MYLLHLNYYSPKNDKDYGYILVVTDNFSKLEGSFQFKKVNF